MGLVCVAWWRVRQRGGRERALALSFAMISLCVAVSLPLSGATTKMLVRSAGVKYWRTVRRPNIQDAVPAALVVKDGEAVRSFWDGQMRPSAFHYRPWGWPVALWSLGLLGLWAPLCLALWIVLLCVRRGASDPALVLPGVLVILVVPTANAMALLAGVQQFLRVGAYNAIGAEVARRILGLG